MTDKNLYKILNLNKEASLSEIKQTTDTPTTKRVTNTIGLIFIIYTIIKINYFN